MSGAGISPLAILAPDLYAKQIAIQRRQALAQGLLQQGEGDPGHGAYGGARSAGNAILGAFLAKRGDQDMANLYSPQPDQSAAPAPQPSPQITNTPEGPPGASGPQMPPQAASGQQAAPMPAGGSSQPSPQALGNALAGPQAQTRPNSIPQAMNGAVPDLPGMSHQQSMLAYFQSPSAYFTALAAAKAPTPDMKNAAFAMPGEEAGQQAAIGAEIGKAGAIPLTRGVLNIPDGHGGYRQQYAPPPAPAGYQYTTGQNGQPVLSQIEGGQQAVQGSAFAQGLGQAGAKPAIGYDPGTNMPIATNQAALLGGNAPQQPLGLRSNNPGNLQPGGQEATYATPTEGILHAASNLDNYAASGINTISGIVSKWAPQSGGNDPQQYAAFVAQKLGVDPNQPLDLKNPQVKGRVLDAMFAFENGAGKMAAAGAKPPQGLLPELPQGQATYMQGQAKDASERHDTTVSLAAESPMRINVLDNIIKLSQSGVGTGPGADFQNSLKGYIANTPGLGKLLGSTQANVGNFQELQKFMYQNALRNWQAAGGTGTDSQLESAAKANPNDHLFPQALQTIAKWGKASELAVQGKANAQDAFLAKNGQTPQNQLKFENTWRNAFDPKVFQYTLMSPAEKQAFAQQDLKTPQAAKAFIAKQQSLKSLGALQ